MYMFMYMYILGLLATRDAIASSQAEKYGLLHTVLRTCVIPRKSWESVHV